MLCICHHYFVFNATATTEIYTDWHTLSLHDALPISRGADLDDVGAPFDLVAHRLAALIGPRADALARGERRDALGGKRRPVATAAGCGTRIAGGQDPRTVGQICGDGIVQAHVDELEPAHTIGRASRRDRVSQHV